ncbi:MAG TPA: hypothetical protein VJ997_12640 [Longimicrobiales bacterium]|nr:hypothetical protein [Longimicrobiales bacterium]
MTGDGRSGPPARRFADHEVAAILRRASIREALPGFPSPHDPTVDDLMAAAVEVGLDPGEVRRAAAVEVRRGATLVDRALGAPDHREVSARLAGARIPADPWEVVRRAEEALGGRGRVVEGAPGRFVWRSDGVGSRNRLTLAERDGVLELTVSTDRAGYYVGLWFVGLLAWAGLSMTTPLGTLPLLGKVLGFLVTPPLVARPFWAAADRRARERLERLALDVLRIAEAGDAAPGDPEG